MFHGGRAGKCSVGRLVRVKIKMQDNGDFVHGGKGLAALSLGLNIFLTASKYLLRQNGGEYLAW